MNWVSDSHEDYLAVDALSSSTIKSLLAKSPAHVLHEKQNPRPTTPAMQMGTWIHTAILQPTEFRPIVLPDPHTLDIRTKAGKPAKNPRATSEWESLIENAHQTANGRPVLDHEQIEIVLGASAAVAAHPLAQELLSKGIAEQSGYAEIDGMPVKIRPDFRRCGVEIIDLKTTDDASPAGFSRKARGLRYDIQAAWYRRIVAQIMGVSIADTTFLWIVVERSAPFGVAVYSPNLGELLRADAEIDDAIATYRKCITTNVWSGYAPTIEPLRLFFGSTDEGEGVDQTF